MEQFLSIQSCRNPVGPITLIPIVPTWELHPPSSLSSLQDSLTPAWVCGCGAGSLWFAHPLSVGSKRAPRGPCQAQRISCSRCALLAEHAKGFEEPKAELKLCGIRNQVTAPPTFPAQGVWEGQPAAPGCPPKAGPLACWCQQCQLAPRQLLSQGVRWQELVGSLPSNMLNGKRLSFPKLSSVKWIPWIHTCETAVVTLNQNRLGFNLRWLCALNLQLTVTKTTWRIILGVRRVLG